MNKNCVNVVEIDFICINPIQIMHIINIIFRFVLIDLLKKSIGKKIIDEKWKVKDSKKQNSAKKILFLEKKTKNNIIKLSAPDCLT